MQHILEEWWKRWSTIHCTPSCFYSWYFAFGCSLSFILWRIGAVCPSAQAGDTWELQQGLHLHIFMSNLVLFKRCTTQEPKMSPSCFHSHSRKGSPMTHSHAVLIHWQLPSWQQNATFTKLYKSLLLSGASWTKTEYIFTARTRFWANFLHFVAKRYDTYVKETFIFCSLTAVRSWGMWKKAPLSIQTEDRAVEIHGKRYWLCTWGPWLCYTCCTHSPGPVLANLYSCAFLHFRLCKANQAGRGCEGLPAPQLQMLPKPPQSSALSSAETCSWNCQITELFLRKDLECMHSWKSKGSQEKAICIEPICYFTNWYLLSFNFTLPYLPLQPVCSRQSIHFTVAIAEPLVLCSRTLCHSFNLEMCCINCLHMWLLIVFKQPANT